MLTTPGSTLERTLCTSDVTNLLLLGPKLVTVRVVVLRPKAATRPPATSAPTRAPTSAAHSQLRVGGPWLGEGPGGGTGGGGAEGAAGPVSWRAVGSSPSG